MTTYTLSVLCALAVFAAVQVPGTSAWFFHWGSSSKEKNKKGGSSSNNNDKKGGTGAISTDAKEIVDKHNALRRSVRPAATNMLKMSWSNEAAANAQKWADGCSLKHSPDRSREISTSGCGENLYMASYKDSWSNAIQSWYDEVKDWRYGVGSTNREPVGHYTQVVWYRSNKVGCGMAHCPNAKYKYFYVCQYCPPGNVNRQYARPYRSGSTCGDCRNACDNKLCTNACPWIDEYSNCHSMKRHCNRSRKVTSGCPATCKCNSSQIK